MNDITMHDAFILQSCEGKQVPRRAVTLGAGAIWVHAYDAVTTKGGHYVQGGGCTTVGVGPDSKRRLRKFLQALWPRGSGLTGGRSCNCRWQDSDCKCVTNPDLLWALKGGGGGSFGVVSKVTLRVRELPEFFGAAIFTIRAASDDAFRRLLHQFFSLYRASLFNDHWGEQAHINTDNSLTISMVSYGLDGEQARKIWQPFLDWVTSSPNVYTLKASPIIASIPARSWWDAA